MRPRILALIVTAGLVGLPAHASAQVGISAGFVSSNVYGTTYAFNNGIGLGYASYPTSFYPVVYPSYPWGFNPYVTAWPEPAYTPYYSAYAPYAYYGYYGAYGPYGPWYGRTVAAPLVLPAETLYGPQAVQRFLGWPTPVYSQPAVVNVASDPTSVTQPLATRTLRVSNANSRALARRQLDAGDTYFRNQQYNSALERYKDAATTAPDLADAYFRQGWAAFALQQYDLAARAIKRGLLLNPDWTRSPFRLDDLYGNRLAIKEEQRTALAQACLEQPNNPDLLFLLGVELYFDGHADRSRAFFQRALAMSGDDSEAIQPFLDAIAGAAPAPAPQEPRGQDI